MSNDEEHDDRNGFDENTENGVENGLKNGTCNGCESIDEKNDVEVCSVLLQIISWHSKLVPIHPLITPSITLIDYLRLFAIFNKVSPCIL